jgi:hypothetical protein
MGLLKNKLINLSRKSILDSATLIALLTNLILTFVKTSYLYFQSSLSLCLLDI